MAGGRPLPTLEEYKQRFWSRVKPGPPWECWEWQGGRTPAGYGQMGMNHRMHPAHRLAWEWTYGPIPDGLHIDHLCRNPPCVNPAHLEPVTVLENQLRGRADRGLLDACPNGHLYAETGVYLSRNGKRQCAECSRRATARYLSRKRAGAA